MINPKKVKRIFIAETGVYEPVYVGCHVSKGAHFKPLLKEFVTTGDLMLLTEGSVAKVNLSMSGTPDTPIIFTKAFDLQKETPVMYMFHTHRPDDVQYINFFFMLGKTLCTV